MGRRRPDLAGRLGRSSAYSFRSYRGLQGYLALRLRQDHSLMAFGFGRSSVCSCSLSATCRPCLFWCTCQQLIFILTLFHSQRVFWKFFPSLCATCVVCQRGSDTHVLLLCQAHCQVW